MSNRIEIFNLDESLITLGPLKKLDSNYGFTFSVQYNGGRFPHVIMPNLTIPTGVKRFVDKAGSKPDDFQAFFSFDGYEASTPRGERLRKAFDKCQKIDERILKLMKDVAQGPDGRKLFPKDAKYNAANIESRFKPFVSKYINPAGKEFADSFKCQLQRSADNQEVFATIGKSPFIVDANKQDLQVNTENVDDILGRGCVVKPVIQLSYIFVAGSAQSYSITQRWRMYHGILVKEAEKQSFDDVIPDEDDENVGLLARGIDGLGKGDESEEVEYEEVDEDDEDQQLAAASR